MKKNKVRTFSTPEEYKENLFGNSIPTSMVLEERKKFAKIFAEGCEPLEKILLSIWENGWETLGCCKGHEVRPFYLKFKKKGFKRMEEDEYERRAKGPWYQKPFGYIKGPEFTLPYIQIVRLNSKETNSFKRYILGLSNDLEDIKIEIEEDSIRLSFPNQYRKEKGKIDNEKKWNKALQVIDGYFEKLNTIWQKENQNQNREINKENREAKKQKEKTR